jgi:acetyl esterase
MHPQTAAYLEEWRDRQRWDLLTVEEAREDSHQVQIDQATYDPVFEAARRQVRSKDTVLSLESLPIPIRTYGPHTPLRSLPIIVFFHGGGFVIGDLDTHDELCRELSARVPAIVVSVGYRLAPENRYPSAVIDSIAATKWIADHASDFGGDSTRIAHMGDSAGGNLAAVVAHTLSSTDGPAIRFQFLVYPVTDNSAAMYETGSAKEFGDGLVLTNEALKWFQSQYFGDRDDRRSEPEASPLRAEDFVKMPPTFIQIAELDPIADSVREYAERLRKAGVTVTTSTYEGQMHAFVTMGKYFDAAFDAVDEAVTELQRALAPKPHLESN